MRTPNLQYLYLQKPVTMVIVICIISVLPWIGLGDFSTKGEPREAAVAVSMLESGNWILPQVYANEFAYKPHVIFTSRVLAVHASIFPFGKALGSSISTSTLFEDSNPLNMARTHIDLLDG